MKNKCIKFTSNTRSPAGAGIANRPLVLLGIFLIFGSNTPTLSVENQLNLWATNCVVNQTGYFGPLYASRHQTLLWRHQHIYFYFAYSSYKAGISGYRRGGFVCKHCVANAPDHTFTPHNPRLQVAYSDYAYPQHCSGGRQMLLPLLGGDAPRLG